MTRCPFLREAQVKSCRAAAFRKFIVRNAGQSEEERCSSPSYVDCPVAKRHSEDRPSVDHCPFLHESLVQYCAAAPIPTYIPYSELGLSLCSTGSHAYCELFAELEHAGPPVDGTPDAPTSAALTVATPSRLFYAPNHLWLDVDADGTYHVGADGFLARAIGAIDELTYLTLSGLQRPAVVLSLRGVDIPLVFPAEMSIRKANTHLRTHPSKLLTDPYGAGWLFEGRKARPTSDESVPGGLIAGKDAPSWMESELGRLDRFVRSLAERPGEDGVIHMNDGGAPADGLCRVLPRTDVLRLANEFFSVVTSRQGVAR